MRIVDFSIRRPVTVLVLFIAIVVFGVVGFGRLSVDLLPDITYPSLSVRTDYEGAAPQRDREPDHPAHRERGGRGEQCGAGGVFVAPRT